MLFMGSVWVCQGKCSVTEQDIPKGAESWSAEEGFTLMELAASAPESTVCTLLGPAAPLWRAMCEQTT
jgi:hypothetical protein